MTPGTTAPRMAVRRPKRGRGRPMRQRTSGLRERAWWLMRQVPRFTLDDLLLTLVDGSEGDPKSNLLKYVSALERVGVLARHSRRQPGTALTSPGAVIWKLVRDLGRQAPVWRSQHQVLFDPNSGALIPTLASLAQANTSTTQPDAVSHEAS